MPSTPARRSSLPNRMRPTTLSLGRLLRPLAPLLLAAAIACGVYAWAKSVTPDYGTSLFGQTGADTLPLKSWLATAVLGLALLQLCTALWLYGRIRRPASASAPPGHRAPPYRGDGDRPHAADRLSLPVRIRLPGLRLADACPLARGLLHLRGGRGQGPRGPLAEPPRLGPPGCRRHARERRGGALVYGRALVLQRSQPAAPRRLTHSGGFGSGHPVLRRILAVARPCARARCVRSGRAC